MTLQSENLLAVPDDFRVRNPAFLRYATCANLLRAALGEIADGKVAADVPDPFNGKPLLRRREGNSLVVWSVGKNRIDDGATSDSDDLSLRLAVAPAASH